MRLSNNIGFIDFVVINNELWFCNIFDGEFIRLNLEKNEFSYAVFRDTCEKRMKMSYGLVECVKDKLYFIPRNETKIFIYSLKNKKAVSLNLKIFDGRCEKPLFRSCCKMENRLVLIPGRYPCIIEINTITDEIKYISANISNGEMFTNCDTVLINHEVVINKKVNEVVYFDLFTEKYKNYPIKMDGMKALTALDIGQKILYAGFGPKIMILDKVSHQIEWIKCCDDCCVPVEGIGQLLTYQDNIYAIAINEPIIYTVSIKKMTFSKWLEYDWGKKRPEIWKIFMKCDAICVKIVGNRMIIYSTMRNGIIDINLQSKKMYYHNDFSWNKENKKQFIKNYFTNDSLIDEGLIELQDFIEYV